MLLIMDEAGYPLFQFDSFCLLPRIYIKDEGVPYTFHHFCADYIDIMFI